MEFANSCVGYVLDARVFWEMLHNKIFCAQAVAHCGNEAALLLYELLVW